MCGRFALFCEGAAQAPRYNIRPSQEILVIVPGSGPLFDGNSRISEVPMVDETPLLNKFPGPKALKCGSIRLCAAVWSFPPPGGMPGHPRSVINARAEGILSKPYFRKAMASGRIAIPASGFYEWEPAGTGPSNQGSRGKSGAPWFFRPAAKGLLFFAGLAMRIAVSDADGGRNPGGGSRLFACIITVEANSAVAPVHHRMPGILDDSSLAGWLDLNGTDPSGAAELLKPAPEGLISGSRVGNMVGRPGTEGPELIEPVEARSTERPRQGTLW